MTAKQEYPHRQDPLLIALADVGPAPCETCAFADYCADGHACRVFLNYAHERNPLQPRKTEAWVPLAFLPDRQTYERLYP